jgi:hypothetical protein
VARQTCHQPLVPRDNAYILGLGSISLSLYLSWDVIESSMALDSSTVRRRCVTKCTSLHAYLRQRTEQRPPSAGLSNSYSSKGHFKGVEKILAKSLQPKQDIFLVNSTCVLYEA